MKFFPFLSLSLVSVLSWSCGTIDPDATISLRGARDPLDRLSLNAPEASGPQEMRGDPSGFFKAGDYVEVSVKKAELFASYPGARSVVKSSLKMGTQLLVLNVDEKFMHVQQEDGEAGYLSNASVVPQGLLVNGTANNAEMEVVNWSDIADSTPDPSLEEAPDEVVEFVADEAESVTPPSAPEAEELNAPEVQVPDVSTPQEAETPALSE